MLGIVPYLSECKTTKWLNLATTNQPEGFPVILADFETYRLNLAKLL